MTTWRDAAAGLVRAAAPEDAADLLESAEFVAAIEAELGQLDPDAPELAEGVAAAVEAWIVEDVEEAWSETAHPRAAAGAAGGGQFVSGGSGNAASSGKTASTAPSKSAGKTTGGKKRIRGETLSYDAKSGRGAGYGRKGGDPRVRRLQTALNRLGLTDGAGRKLVLDGKLGPRTTAAVKAAQKRLGLPADGKVTPQLLVKLSAAKSLPAPKKAAATKPPAKPAAKPKARTREGDEVEVADRIPGRVLESKGADDSGGRVFRVRIIAAGDSKNGRRYPAAVLTEAVRLYEGAKAYDHHRSPEELRSSTISGLVGSYRNVEASDEGIDGDLHLLPSATHTAEALDASLAAVAEGRPPLVGISHDAMTVLRPVMVGGRRIHEAVAIARVHSADVVADPAAGGAAVRVLAGGIDDEDEPAGEVPDGDESEGSAVTTLSKDDVLAALSDASPDELAAVGLTRAPAAEPAAPVEPAPTSEAATGVEKTSFLGGLMIERMVESAGLPVTVATQLATALPDRITESDVLAQIAALKSVLGVAERAGLAPTATARVTQESRDKQGAALDKFFQQDYVGGYRSLKQAYMDVTGWRGDPYTTDLARQVLRESFGGGFDSAVRSTESADTTTWAQVLGDSVTRRVVAEYQVPNLQTWRQVVSSIVPVDDFRTQRVGRVGGYGVLPTVNQGQPYQPLTTPPDEEATYALAKKGGTEDLTFEAIANDDRRLVSQIPRKLGRAAAQTLYRFVWDFFVNNPSTTYDSTAWFHASHANTAGSAALSQSTLSAASVALMEQTAYGNSYEVLGEPARLLVVPPELRELAYQLTASSVAIPSTPAGASNTPNIHNADGIRPIVVPYWTDANDWFAIADPAAVPTIEVGFYQGRETPEIFTQADANVGSVFNADVFTWKIRFIFSGTILDHRGVYRGQG